MERGAELMRPSIVEIDGERFFTAGWVMAQMTYMTGSIRRAKCRANWSMALTAIALLLSLAAIAT